MISDLALNQDTSWRLDYELEDEDRYILAISLGGMDWWVA